MRQIISAAACSLLCSKAIRRITACCSTLLLNSVTKHSTWCLISLHYGKDAQDTLVHRLRWVFLMKGCAAAEGSAPQASEYPAPPGTPSLTSASDADTIPPPSYNEAIRQQASAVDKVGHAAKPENDRAAGDSPVSRAAPHGSPGSESRAGQQQHGSPEAIDRSAEEALQIQVSLTCMSNLQPMVCCACSPYVVCASKHKLPS